MSLSPPIRFGIFEVDPEHGEVRRQGVKISLQDQPLQVLLALLAHAPNVVTREELKKMLWPADTFVDFERGLNRAISRLRDALRDVADNPRFIETLPRRGYRFIAPVGIAQAEVSEASLEPGALSVRPHERLLERSEASLAVLPLVSLSDDPDQAYFADSLTDELITVVAKIRTLRVISRTSVMQWKGVPRPLAAMARQLNVDVLLEGTVARWGRKVRIAMHLIQARDDRHLWSEAYERDLDDILAIQRDVAQAIADQIQVTLTPVERRELARTRRVNPQAYEAYLKGRYFRGKWTAEALDLSIEWFVKATALDPASAESYAGLSNAYCAIGILGTRPPREVYPLAKAAAQQALAIDETVAEAHVSLAEIAKGFDWDLSAAEPMYRRGLDLDPSSAVGHAWYADCLSRMGRHQDAIATAHRARALDPLSADRASFFGFILYRARRYDEALEACREAAARDPDYPPAHWFLGLVHVQRCEYVEAISAFERAVQCSGNGTPYRALLAHGLAISGNATGAAVVLDELVTLSRETYVSPLDFAIVYAALNDRDAAFGWLEQAYGERTTRIQELSHPCFDRLRADPRFGDLMRRIGLPF